jgi:hypothetical protein
VGAVDALAPAASGGTLSEHALTPEFMAVRALACEAYYSDFVAPGAPVREPGRRSTSGLRSGRA